MKKTILSIAVIIQVFYSSAQNDKVSGLYGECDKSNSGYICQQFQIFEDSTFIFYDLLHLRGWKLSHGKWILKNDTLVLNSYPRDIKIDYLGNNISDSIILNLFIDDIPAIYSSIILDSKYQIDCSGHCKIAKKNSINLIIDVLGVPRFAMSLDSASIVNASEARIYINSESIEEFHFNNEKWLIEDNKIFHTVDSLGEFDRDLFWSKIDQNQLIYKK